MVNAGSGNPLFVVARIKPLRVYINVPESMAQDAAVGVTAVGVVGSDNKVELKRIIIGKDLGTNLEITEGLSPDDRVIVDPSDSLASGQIVRVLSSQNEKKQATATPEAKHS